MIQIVKDIIWRLKHHPYWAEYENSTRHLILENNETQKRAIDHAERFGFPLLGHGCFRFVLDIDNYAVKLPLQAAGFMDNEEEKRIWNEMPPHARCHFVPFLGGTGDILIFEKADVLTEEDYKQSQEPDDVWFQLNEMGIEVEDTEGHEQWGYVRDHLVILDYSETVLSC